MKRFTKKIEDFNCEKCGQEVKGSGYTNHCPNCLWSKHVDINPGDRLGPCQGMMKPVTIEGKTNDFKIVHECTICGFRRVNRVEREDDIDAVLAVIKTNADAFLNKGKKK